MNIAKQKATEFINQLEVFSETINSNNVINDSFGIYNEKDFLANLIKQARELIEYNEWYIALENTIENLFEVDYKLESNLINLAIIAFKENSLENNLMIKALEEMRK